MGFLALAVALGALVCAVSPHPGMYLGMGLGILGLGLGVIGWRRRAARPAARLSGAAGITVAVIALSLAGLRYWATLTAIERLENLL